MRKYLLNWYLFLTGLVFCPLFSLAQEPVAAPKTTTTTAQDTVRVVEILPGVRKLEIRKVDDSTQLQILAGNVRLKQGNSYFYCDSCIINNRSGIFEAFGNVRINDSDTANAYSDYLLYLIDKKTAYLKGNVKLHDGKGILTTPELEYDINTKIGIYTKTGKVVNNNTTLTSGEGYYYTDMKDVYFRKNVELKDPAYYLKTESLLYNTETETARFIAYTYIKDSSGRIIETSEGYYNLKTGKAEFGKRPFIRDGKRTIRADRVATDDSTGISQAVGNVVIVDSAQNMTVIAGEVFSNNKKETMLATRKPLMIIKQDNDSIYIAADTLYSARLTDLFGARDSLVKDTIKGINIIELDEKDSTNRYFEAFRNVRIFSDSLQAVCDSLFYSFRDSIFRLFDKPVVWSNRNQVSGDTILLFTKNKKADRFRVWENSFIVSKLDPEIFNQVKSTRMEGFLSEGSIDSVNAKGMAETIYYIQDEDSSYSGINQSQSDALDLYFHQRELQKVVFRSAVSGTIWPIRQKDPREMRLPNFAWYETRRPKTKFELFE
jgi:lipopolysaccharide export system protein LptA